MKKLGALREGLSKSNELFISLSRQIHWYIEIQEPRRAGEELVTKACPYLDFSDAPAFTSIHDFAASAATEACNEDSDPSMHGHQNSYLKWVCGLFAKIESEEPVAAGAKGLKSTPSTSFLVAINKNGETYWIAVTSIEHIFMDRYQLSLALGLEIDFDGPRYEQKIGLDDIDEGYGFKI